jgi:hypothetical protein
MTSASGSQGGSALPTLDWSFDKAGNRTTRHANSSVDEIYTLASGTGGAMHRYASVARSGIGVTETLAYNAAGSLTLKDFTQQQPVGPIGLLDDIRVSISVLSAGMRRLCDF